MQVERLSLGGAAAHDLSRAEFLKRIGLAACGLAAGCTPLRIVLHDYASAFEDRDVTEPVLRGFVTAVIPGAPRDAPDLARVYLDRDYPFAPYAAFFASDLCRRAHRLFGTANFHRLDLAQRTRVIQDGLRADSTTKKLYHGALFLGQISFYAGIYGDQAGCALIEFEGSKGILPLEQQTYAMPERYLASALTSNGNLL